MFARLLLPKIAISPSAPNQCQTVNGFCHITNSVTVEKATESFNGNDFLSYKVYKGYQLLLINHYLTKTILSSDFVNIIINLTLHFLLIYSVFQCGRDIISFKRKHSIMIKGFSLLTTNQCTSSGSGSHVKQFGISLFGKILSMTIWQFWK